MPRFKVIQYRDACVRYEVELDAQSAEAALEHARTKGCAWIYFGVSPYDSADMEVLDVDGHTIIASHQVW